VVPRPLIRLVWNLGADLRGLPKRLSRKEGPEPWRVMHNVGGGDYHRTGRRYAKFIREMTGLKPDGHVLDIGCGTGRVAAPLVTYLGEGGRYTGFDISKRATDWARAYLPETEAAVDIHHADLGNTEYNKSGADAASRYAFPAGDADVDATFAISLYTHLLAADAQAYLRETARVLKPGGRAFITAFLMTEMAASNIRGGTSRMPFEPMGEGVYTTDPDTPEHAIAFDESLFLSWAQAAGLAQEGEIKRGFWFGTDRDGELQDIIILRRPA